MILSFSTKFKDGTPTDFQRKITDGEKIHTIRLGQRWAPGKKIHFATGVRTKKYNNFKTGECTSVEDIQITFVAKLPSNIHSKEINCFDMFVFVGSRRLRYESVLELAKNDGLTIDQFKSWFLFAAQHSGHYSYKQNSHTAKGQIIHWTSLKYCDNQKYFVD